MRLKHFRNLCYSLCFLLVCVNVGWGQTVFYDTFGTAANSAFTGGTSTTPTAISYTTNTNFGVVSTALPPSGTDAFLQLTGSAAATQTPAAWARPNIVYPFSSLPSGLNTTLSSNVAPVTWSFNMRTGRLMSSANQGYNDGNYYGAVVLCATNATFAGGTGSGTNGYAVILQRSTSDATKNSIRLVKFANGIGSSASGSTVSASLIQTPVFAVATATNQNNISVKVVYTPGATNPWELFYREDSATTPWATVDPLSGSLSSAGVSNDATYTGTGMTHFGILASGATSTTTTNNQQFDNFKIGVAILSPIITNPSVNTLSSLNYIEGNGPSNVKSFTIGGDALTNSLVLTVADPTILEINNPAVDANYSSSITLSSGTVASTTINVRLKAGLTPGSYNDKIINITSTGATSKTVSCSGNVSSAVDDSAPNAPGTASITNQTLSTMTTNWIAASGGVDGGGYMVLRYSGDPSSETGGGPVQKTTYAVNDIIATGTNPDGITAPKSGKVVYLGTDLSYVSTGLTAADTSHFRIYTFDAARNYSGSSFVSGKTATAIATPVALASSLSTATGFTANWNVAPVVSTYNINVYTAAAAVSTVVGWTITDGTQTAATSVLASATTANNTTNTLTQNGGGSINTTVSGNPGFAARGATYYSTFIVSGTEGIDAVYGTPKADPDKYWQVTANTVGYKNVTISSDQYSTETGPRDWKLQYSSDGGSTFSDLTNQNSPVTLTLAPISWNSTVSNIALPESCENNPNVVIRWLQTSFTNTSGNPMTTTGGTSRIDNILVKGTKLTLVKAVTEGNNLGTSKAITGLDAGTYYYDVVVSKDDVTGTTGIVSKYVNSGNSNLMQGATLTPLTAPVATASSNPTESGFTANWGAVAGATDYRFSLYATPTQSDIVGWNFDTNLLATTTSANNTTNAVVQSKGTAGIGTVASNTCVTATTSAWTPVSGLASGTNWEIQVNTLGYYNTTVSSKQYASQAATAARDFKVQYKIGANGTYTDVPSATIIVARDWTTGVLNNVALPAECDNQPLVYLRWINYTTLATDGINTITAGGISLDDVFVRGRNLSLEAGYPVTVSASRTSRVLTGLAQGNYYYDVIARGDNITTSNSIKSNLIGSFVNISSTIANFRSTASGNLTSTDIWEYYNGVAWLTATSAPSGTNNITISAGHTIALEGNFTVDT